MAESERRKPLDIPLGGVRFGDLKRLSPIGRNFGYERGTPVDRYYIESFLARNAGDIRGRVLELATNDYTKRFGGTRVVQSDVLSVAAADKNATIIGDLVQADTLPEASFDCIIFTQALQYIYDAQAAINVLHRALKPDGVLLATAPGIGPMGDHPAAPGKPDRWPWYWAITPAGLHHLLEERFGQNAVAAETHGNIFTAMAFLYGLAREEIDACDLDIADARFPVTVAARAIKCTNE